MTGAKRDRDGNIVSLEAVQRTARANYTEWSDNLSKELAEWYIGTDTERYTKRRLELTGSVFIEATELGDVLVAGGLPFLQGAESPLETDWVTQETCGQVWTLTFYMELLAQSPQPPQHWPAGKLG